MNENKIIVVADLGSTQIRLLAANVEAENSEVNILALETEEHKKNYISQGAIKNTTDFAFCLNKMCNLLGNTIGRDVHSLYVSLGGVSIRSIKETYVKTYGTTVRLTAQDLVTLKKEALKTIVEPTHDVLLVEPQWYKVDGELETEVPGLKCNTIEVEYLIVYCDRNVKENLEKLFAMTDKIDVCEFMLSIERSAKVLLSEKQRREGVTLIDFGATTTSLVVYKDNTIRQLSVIPFGGDNISKDIAIECGIDFDLAERLKFGKVSAQMDENKQNVVFTINKGQEQIRYTMLVDIVVARLNEIMSICKVEMAKSGVENELKGGIVITGGASYMNDLERYLEQYFSMSVTRADIFNNINFSGKEPSSDIASLIGVVLKADINCVAEQKNDDEEKPNSGNTKHSQKKQGKGFLGMLGGLFDDEKAME